jgi:Tol biopolymer transport system component
MLPANRVAEKESDSMRWTLLARRDCWVLGTVALLCAPVFAQVTQRMSLSSRGVQGNDHSFLAQEVEAAISADGRYVVFWSLATNLVPGDTHGSYDVFVRDRVNGTIERVSVDSAGVQGTGDSLDPSISADGRYVAFESQAPNLVPGDTNGSWDAFVHDRQSGTTERLSVDSGGVQGNNNSFDPCISADDRYVAFYSSATNLVSGDTNEVFDIFVRDRQGGTTERVSVDSSGVQADGESEVPSISADGRYVAFQSLATNLVPGDTNGSWDIFVRDRQGGTTERVSVDSTGGQGDGNSYYPAISADGRYVAFYSLATKLVPGDKNRSADVFVHDRQRGTTERVSVDSSGTQGDGESRNPWISADGRYVAFESLATNLVPGDTNGIRDVFVRDRRSGTTERASVDSGGGQGNGDSGTPSISADGRYVAFHSFADNLVPGDTAGVYDVFIHDRAATSFSSGCDPGEGVVLSCPCSNPPGGSGRGCENSAATGGAVLSAAGIAYLSMDSLVFATDGETPTSTSIVLQGHAVAASGVVYGQGVRCVGGTLKRLFVKIAVAGSITAPDFGAGDPTVSARSAAKGDVIQAGQSRWYLVYYRDPIVLGGCPASSTFNATQTGRVDWSM